MSGLFEVGKTYTFYFSSDQGVRQITGLVVEYETPLAKVETEGLTRVINCASSLFLEAVRRRDDEPIPPNSEDR
jgi:hypothetical protein